MAPLLAQVETLLDRLLGNSPLLQRLGAAHVSGEGVTLTPSELVELRALFQVVQRLTLRVAAARVHQLSRAIANETMSKAARQFAEETCEELQKAAGGAWAIQIEDGGDCYLQATKTGAVGPWEGSHVFSGWEEDGRSFATREDACAVCEKLGDGWEDAIVVPAPAKKGEG